MLYILAETHNGFLILVIEFIYLLFEVYSLVKLIKHCMSKLNL